MATQQFKGNSNMLLLHMGSAFSLFLVQFVCVCLYFYFLLYQGVLGSCFFLSETTNTQIKD